jgi:cellulose synthase operon protein B
MIRRFAHRRGIVRIKEWAIAAVGLWCAISSSNCAVAADPISPAEDNANQIIWRMPGDAASMRITGEDGAVVWPVYVPEASVGRLKRFQLAFQAAISVMPEGSWMTLTINGKMIGRVPIAAPKSVKVLDFDLPPGSLAAGWNAVQVSVVERHRVDCSIDATYELWTQIDAVRTGLVGPPPAFKSLDDLASVSVDDSGAQRIRLTMPPNAAPSDIARMLSVIERIALRGRFLHPVVDASATPRASLKIAFGPSPELDEVSSDTLGPGLRIATTKDGTPMLIVAEGDLKVLSDALDLQSGDLKGSREGLRALSNASGARVQLGAPVTLADLGLTTHVFTGRLFRSAVDLVLPPDAYLADYGEARLSLDGGYAADLTSVARLVVRVNGVIDGSLAFDRASGAAMKDQIVHMPLSAFRAGRNHIEIEVQLPTHADEVCDTLASIGAKERFLILGTSTLSIPNLARIARFPNLSATFVNGFRVTRTNNPALFLPRITPSAVTAAATILANVAAQTGAPIDAEVYTGQPKDDGGSIVAVGVASDLPVGLLTKAGLDAPSISSLWGADRKSGDVTGAIAIADHSEKADTDRQRLDAWGERLAEPNNWAGPWLDWVSNVSIRSLRAAGLIDFANSPYSITPDTSFVAAQGMFGDSKLTVFAAPDDASLDAGASSLTNISQLSRIDGRAAALDTAGTGLDLVAAHDPSFFRTVPFGFSNDRLIAAGWLSSHAAWYICMALALALLLGVFTWATLAFSRRSS